MYKIRDMSSYPSERERKGPSYVTNKYKKKNYKQTELIYMQFVEGTHSGKKEKKPKQNCNKSACLAPSELHV
jgi:hypothetical protein